MQTLIQKLTLIFTSKKGVIVFALLSFGLYFFVLIHTAWISDDAFITFRTVRNFNEGYGLTWNIVERVQAYTHPLWMFALSFVYFFTHEIYWSSLFLSMALSGIALFIFLIKIPKNLFVGSLGVFALALSKAFVDYSTSGLENPLSNIILVLYFWVFLKHKTLGKKDIIFLSFLASLGMLCRMDYLLLFAPPILFLLWEKRSLKNLLLPIIAGFPLVFWEIFSVLYYGSFVPNTAYSKLGAGVPQFEMLIQGIRYFGNSWYFDPITLSILFLAIIFSFAFAKNRKITISSLGLVLYMLYILKIGGDFMSGRFFATPVLLAIILLSQINIQSKFRPLAIVFVWITYLMGAQIAPLNIIDNRQIINQYGIQHEREYYYSDTGLLADRTNNSHVQNRVELQTSPDQIQIYGAIGVVSYYQSHDGYIYDVMSLSDPYLSMIPSVKSPYWRIGHFERIFPEGYKKARYTNGESLTDPTFKQLYQQKRAIITDDFWDIDRMIKSISFALSPPNTENERYRNPYQSMISLSEFPQFPDEYYQNKQYFYELPSIAFGSSGILIDLETITSENTITFHINPSHRYLINFYRNGAIIYQTILEKSLSNWAYYTQTIEHSFPKEELSQGYDSIELIPADTIPNTIKIPHLIGGVAIGPTPDEWKVENK